MKEQSTLVKKAKQQRQYAMIQCTRFDRRVQNEHIIGNFNRFFRLVLVVDQFHFVSC